MESLLSNIYLIFYIIAWIVTILLYQKRKKCFDAGSVLLFSYLLYSIMSLFLYNTYNPFFTFTNIQLFPFIYLYLMLMLAFSPILKYDETKIIEIQKPSTIFLNIISIIFIVASLAQLPSIISDFSVNIVKLLTVTSGGQDLYDEAMSNSFSSGDGDVSNFASIFSGAFFNIGVLLFFYNLTLKKYNILILIGLFLSCILSLFTYVSLGQRGLIIEILFVIIITFFALRKFIPEKTNKIIKYTGVLLIFSISLPLIALTNSRFENEEGGSKASIYYYAGQENLYFNIYGLDDGGIRYGDRTFPLFKSMLGFENVPHNFWERRDKYPDLKINDEVFYTFVGDFTIDFGPYLPPFIFLIFTLFVLRKTKIFDGKIQFHQLILLHFVMCICMLGGMKLYSFSDIGGNLQLIVYVIAYIVFRFDYTLQKQREERLLKFV